MVQCDGAIIQVRTVQCTHDTFNAFIKRLIKGYYPGFIINKSKYSSFMNNNIGILLL